MTLPCNWELSSGTETFSVQQPCDDPIAVNRVIELQQNKYHDGWFGIGKKSTGYTVDLSCTEELSLTFTEFATEESTKIDINET